MQILGKLEVKRELLDYVDKWKDKSGIEIMVLHKIQEIYGYVPREVAMEISRILNIPLAKIYGIITFYNLFKLNRPGKYKISVCMGTACYLQDNTDILAELENDLGIGVNCTTDDGLFHLELVRCLGCCGLSPVLMIDNKVYGKLTRKDIPKILVEYQKDKTKGGSR